MKDKVAKLIDVKSIMTLALTGGFIALTCAGEITGEQFLTIFYNDCRVLLWHAVRKK